MSKRNNSTVRRTKLDKKETQGRVVKEKFQNENYLAQPVQAKNKTQKKFLHAINNKKVIVFNAPAGVGKSYITMSEVTDWIKRGEYDKVMLCRPSIGMGKSLGLLPGSLEEKYTPYLLPLLDVVKSRYGSGFYESSVKNGTIEFCPLEFIRGRSFECVVVLDEGQNTTPEEMYTFLTRVGEEGKLIIIGDPTQNDLKVKNGITWLCEFIEDNPSLKEDIAVITATSDDIVRSGLCKKVVKAKEKVERRRR